MTSSSSQQRVCLVTPGHLSTNPRLVKEADALTSAGYAVSVVCARFIPWAEEADLEFSSRPWAVHRVSFGPIAGRLRHVAQILPRRVGFVVYRMLGCCSDLAFHSIIPALSRAACAVPADFYIAHNLAALPAAYRAARKHGAKLGFDAEDFHAGQLDASPENALLLRLTRAIELRYLPCCDYLTAASPGIAKAYADTYGVKEPVVILNVFPKSHAPAALTSRGVAQPSPCLYWFSQTIGPDRGLETVIEAIGLSQSRPTLVLRGNLSLGYHRQLSECVAKFGVADKVRILPPAAPGDMVRLAAEYDVGLATETNSTLNRDICLTNKLFTFLLAGMPILASDTTAQKELGRQIPGAVFVYPQADAEALAARMDELLSSFESLRRARAAAWQAGHSRFNWDFEKSIFLDAVKGVLS